MSFQNFLKLAQQNQARNDDRVKKISEDLKRRKELLIKERRSINEANRRPKTSITTSPHVVTNGKEQAVPQYSPDNNITQKTENSSDIVYVPTPIPKKKPSSLMDALEEMNARAPIPFAKKRKFDVKIPKISGSSNSLSSCHQNESVIPKKTINPFNCLSHAEKVESGERVPSPYNPSSKNFNSSQLRRKSPGVLPAAAHSVLTNRHEMTFQHAPSCLSSVKTPYKVPHPISNSATGKQSFVQSSDTNKNLHPILMKSKPQNKPSLPLKCPTSAAPISRSHNLKRSVPLAGPLSQVPTTVLKSLPCPQGIAAQLAPASKTNLDLPSRSFPKKPTSTSVNQRPKVASVSNANKSLRPARVPTDKHKLSSRAEAPLKPSRADSRPTILVDRSPFSVPAPRGIAAQYGSLGPLGCGGCPNNYLDNDSDDYASDDSFIDDTDCASAKEYLKAVEDIHKSLHFDPTKYAKVSKYDDLATMESSYRQIEKEEKLSMRLAAREDEEDMAIEAERKRRKMAKKTT